MPAVSPRRYTFVSILLVSTFLSPPARPNAPPDGARLFREETIDGPSKIGWKASDLSDETRLAIAATGLSWQPESDGTPLIRRVGKQPRFSDSDERYRAFQRLRGGERKREAFSYALSILLDPPMGAEAWPTANSYLDRYRDEAERALIGVLQAPDKLPLLPSYRYAAVDCLVRRSTPRLLPLMLSLAESSDRYLRSRAVASLGIIAWRPGPRRDSLSGLDVPLHENSLSAVQMRMIVDSIHRAAGDKNWRTRAAAALALGLIRDEADLPLIQRLSRDNVYLRSGSKAEMSVVFPVREQAAASLARLGRDSPLPGFARGQEAGKATRGGHDVTNDFGDVRKELISRVRFNDIEW